MTKREVKMDKEKIKALYISEYDKWFERWYKRMEIEKRIKESAMKGYEGTYINCNMSGDEYLRRRLQEERFVILLKEKLPGFEIGRKETLEDYVTILGTRKREINKVEIKW